MIKLRLPKGKRRLRPGSLIAAYAGFRPQLRKSRGVLAGAMGSMIAYAIFQVLRPWPLKIVLDAALAQGDGPVQPVVGWLPALSREHTILAASAAILVIAALGGVAAYGQSYLGAKAGQLLAYRLRRDLFRHVHRLSLSFHDSARTGDLLLRMTGDMNLIRNLLVRSTLRVVSHSLVVAGVAVLMFLVDWQLTLLALLIVPLLVLTSVRFSRRIKTAVRKQREREGDIAASSAESFGSIAVVKLHGAAAAEDERVMGSHRSSLRQGLRATKLQAGLERRVEMLIAVGTCVVLWFGARKVMSGAMTAGDLVLAIAYLSLVYKPMRTFSRLTGGLAKGVVAAERVLEVLREAPEELHGEGLLRPTFLGRLELSDVTFGYDPASPILHGISLRIEPGERVALVGRSGSGKTTLVRLIPRLYTPQQGTIAIDGIPVETIELAHLRDQVGFVLQETVLFGLSIRDNITYGRDDLDEADVELAAKRAGIHERILRLPEGYDTVLAEGGHGLSGGERQRVALARAFVRRTPIVILDEPDSFLDAAVRERIWRAIDELTTGRSSLCIVHDLERARLADRIVVLDQGRIAGDGKHDDLLAGCPSYAELWARRSHAGTAGATGGVRAVL
jgi:ABC-type multidrug transport system fused ATPase/permease subunit